VKPTGSAQRFPQFGVASCVYWLKGRESAIPEYEKVIGKSEGTFTDDRATYCLGHISRESSDKERVKRGAQLLRDLAYSPRFNEWTNKARVVYRFDLNIHEGHTEGNTQPDCVFEQTTAKAHGLSICEKHCKLIRQNATRAWPSHNRQDTSVSETERDSD
jgi:hypothetical protein